MLFNDTFSIETISLDGRMTDEWGRIWKQLWGVIEVLPQHLRGRTRKTMKNLSGKAVSWSRF